MTPKPKTALITGAAKRIGAAIATDLAEQGFNLVVHYASSKTDADELVTALRSHGGDVVALQADLTEAEDTENLFRAACDRIGPIDLLINNASIFEPDRASQFEAKKWDQHFNIHVRAPCLLGSLFAAQTAIDQGLIVNVIDQRVERPNPTYFSYTLSKSALWMATKTMAQEFAPRVRVNAIGPGPTLPNKRQSESDFDQQVAALPLQRGPDPKEFGATVRYLYDCLSISGQMIMLDGGQHLAWQTPDMMVRE